MKTYTKVKILIAIFICSFNYSNAQWQQCTLSEESFECIAIKGDTIFAGSYNNNNIYRSFDNGTSWTILNIGLTNHPITSIVISESNIFVCAYGDGVFLSNDNGENWAAINNGLPIFANIKSLVISGNNIFAGTTSNGVYISTDNGANWSAVNNGLPDTPICSLASDGNNIFVGSYHGISLSNNNGSSWTEVNNGLPEFPIVTSIAIKGNNIFAVITGIADQKGIYLSSNNGGSWTKILNLRISSVAIYDNYILAGGFDGVYLSLNNGSNWVLLGTFGTDKIMAAVNETYLFLATCNDIYRYPLSVIDFNSYTGNVFNDLNSNGIKDDNEVGLQNFIIHSKANNYFTNTDEYGDYTANTISNNADTIELVKFSPYFNTSPQYYVVSQSDSAKNFAVNFIPDIKDLKITLTNITPARPGFDYAISITYSNVGTDTLSGYFNLGYDSSLTFLSSTPSQFSINNNNISWNYSNLIPFESRSVIVNFNIHTSVSIGDYLSFTSNIFPVVGDVVPENNSNTFSQIVTGSFDPNEKEVFPKNGLNILQIANGEKLVYTIHFQNTGNDTAFNIKILDTLSRNLDVSSFELLASSHQCTYKIYGAGITEFTFKNILLPDSNVNFIESNGFVKYAIKADSLLTINDSINNTAYIYFDFNEAIVTNTTNTVVNDDVGLFSQVNENNLFTIFPNPTYDNITLRFNLKEKPLVEIYNIQGKCIYSKQAESNSLMNINVSSFASGFYFIKVNTLYKNVVRKFIKK